MAMLLGVVILGESFTLAIAAGSALILLGSALPNSRRAGRAELDTGSAAAELSGAPAEVP